MYKTLYKRKNSMLLISKSSLRNITASCQVKKQISSLSLGLFHIVRIYFGGYSNSLHHSH